MIRNEIDSDVATIPWRGTALVHATMIQALPISQLELRDSIARDWDMKDGLSMEECLQRATKAIDWLVGQEILRRTTEPFTWQGTRFHPPILWHNPDHEIFGRLSAILLSEAGDQALRGNEPPAFTCDHMTVLMGILRDTIYESNGDLFDLADQVLDDWQIVTGSN